ncbi:Branched-chain-amino-acid aminotransferase [Rosistilla ulvae]|uniref:Branched-chain-amino-acid aminotransferase n=1 Tax=Rosistilla ulvae TaxID=1930277 RepID=A0A517LWP2_9BACT|nr:branched-chain amino acid transaminase [Rosistilla ulvae]QDS87038.1 Branched-chain-amino-acid aminotransferase [Rosistilla ulvae]
MNNALTNAVVTTRSEALGADGSAATDPTDRLIYFKGAFVPACEAKVSVLSPTSQFGLNVFEGIRGYWSADALQLLLFRLPEHIERLFQSCKILGLKCPLGAEELEEKICKTITLNRYQEDVAIRATVFVDEEGSWSSSEPVQVFIAPMPRPRTNIAAIEGKSACISTWKRIDDRTLPPRVKCGANYINGRYAFLEAKRNGFEIPFLLDASGKVSESPGACIFLVRNGELVTPSISNSILESITRDTILRLALDLGIQVRERDVDRSEFYIADEAFVCGTAAEIGPITSVDRLPIGRGKVGPITTSLYEAYLNVVSNANAPYPEWRTPV